MLVRMDVENPPPSDNGVKKGGKSGMKGGAKKEEETRKKFDPSRNFRRSAPSFILFTVLPYMFQIILFGEFGTLQYEKK